MGFFSFKTLDTDKSISNLFSSRGTFSVTMIDNKGNRWHEENYEGYGVFGNKDYYELLAEMNGLKKREMGIQIYHNPTNFNKKLKYPNITESKNWKWVNKWNSICNKQGYFYD